jgi:RHS repeat-associated protein
LTDPISGTLNEPGKVTVAGQAAWMQGATNFIADVVLTNGTNTVAVVATDASTNSRTNTYRMVLSGGGSTSPTYDANGNMLSDGTQTYGWDAANRLVKVTYGSGATSEFSYDAFGRRVKIVEKNSAGTVTSTRQFLYDGLAIAEQRDATNTVVRRYFEDGWRDVAGGVSYTVTKDHLGSIREVVDGSGNLVSRYDYDPYGRVTKVSGTVDSDMLYTGHYHHGPSGLHLALYRAYDPDIARWLSPDPIGEAGGVNLYGYVENNPPNRIDPLGLKFTPVGDDAYVNRVNEDLQKIEDALRNSGDSQALNAFLDLKNDENHNVDIKDTKSGNSYDSGCDTVNYNPRNGRGGKDASGSRKRPPFVGLGHEIGHAIDDYDGGMNMGPASDPKRFPNAAEEEAVDFENAVRKGRYPNKPSKQRVKY